MRVQPSTVISKFFQIGGDGSVQLGSLLLVLSQGLGEPVHLLVKWLLLVVDRRCANKTARSKHVSVRSNVIESRSRAETWDIDVIARVLTAAPSVVCICDFCDVFVAQLAIPAIHQY